MGQGKDAFAPPLWEKAFEDGTFDHCYIDPRVERGLPEEDRCRVLYCATRRAGAYEDFEVRM